MSISPNHLISHLAAQTLLLPHISFNLLLSQMSDPFSHVLYAGTSLNARTALNDSVMDDPRGAENSNQYQKLYVLSSIRFLAIMLTPHLII